jgi:hypothetical protein
VQAGQPQACLAEDRVCGVRGTGERDAELLVLDTRADGVMGVAIDLGRHPQQYLLVAGQRPEVGHLIERVDHDTPDAVAESRLEVLGGLGIAVQDEPPGGEPRGSGHRHPPTPPGGDPR